MDPKYIKKRYLSTKVEGGFGGASGFIRNSKYRDGKKVLKTLQELKTYILHRPVRKRFPRRPVILAHSDLVWAMDIIIYEKYKRQNKGFSNILLVVDVFSKWLMTHPLHGRTADDVHDALLDIFKQSKRKPKKLWADRDTAFTSRKFTGMLKKQGIQLYHSTSYLKSSPSERKILHLKFWQEL